MKRLSILLLLGASVVSCGAPPEETSVSRDSEAIAIEASSASRAELGVARWSVEKRTDGRITGYDADDRVVVELTHVAGVVEGQHVDTYVLGRDHDSSSHVVLAFEPDGAVTVRESVVSEEHRRTAELIAGDLRTQPRVSSGSSLTSASFGNAAAGMLQPLDGDLVSQDCVDLVNQCNTLLTTNNAAQAEFVQYCVADLTVNENCRTKPGGSVDQACVQSTKAKCSNASAKKAKVQEGAQKCTTDTQYSWCKSTVHP